MTSCITSSGFGLPNNSTVQLLTLWSSDQSPPFGASQKITKLPFQFRLQFFCKNFWLVNPDQVSCVFDDHHVGPRQIFRPLLDKLISKVEEIRIAYDEAHRI